DVEGLRLRALALDLQRPRTRPQLSGMARGIVLVDAELVEVVVVGDVLERGLLLVGRGLSRLHALQLLAVDALGRAGNAREQESARASGAERQQVATAQVERPGSDLGRPDAHASSRVSRDFDA